MEKRMFNSQLKENVTAYALLLPALIFLVLFTFYPMGQTVILSLFQSNLGVPEPFFVGLSNYQKLMEDEVFWKVTKNTIIFVLGTVPISMILALAMAVFVNHVLRGSQWLKTMFFYPTVVPAIAIANIWLFIYTPEYGLLGQILGWLNLNQINWLGSQETVLGATMVMAVWKEAGFYMIFYLAGLQNISKELYEAAKIDGASSWQLFRRVTFPLLMPSTLFVFIIASTHSFKLVDHLVVMTQGGPNNASNLLLYYIYETAFKFWDEGRAATLTVIFLLILLIVASIQFFGMEKKIHYR
ncbi:carbohydrate ABC transporter permease [Bacillus sp. AK128]